MRRLAVVGWCIFLLLFACPLALFAEEPVLTMATTTSTENTGLLDYLAPEFRKTAGIVLRWTATGTGKALKLGENCDVDLLMVHAPPAEKEFTDKGFGIDRREIMFNDFVIIGPERDPAGIGGKSVTKALKILRDTSAIFVSRGDNSGTHMKEISLWKSMDLPVPDKESWYLQTGQGMLATIHIASERKGYTMTDRATYIKYEDSAGGIPPLKILVEGDRVLMNQYSVIAVNRGHCPGVRSELATGFIDWIAGADAQQLIRDFKLLGQPLFTPNAKP